MEQINHQIQRLNVTVATGYHVDASITHSPRKPKTRTAYEVVSDREERDDETDAQTSMRVIAVTQPGVDIEARWVSIRGQSFFGYKQHTLVDHNGLVMAVETTAANCHDSKLLLTLLDKAEIVPGTRVHADKAYCSQKHREALKSRGIKNGSQARWFGSKILRYCGRAKAYAWHILQAMAYNLKRLPRLYVERLLPRQPQASCVF